MCQRQRAGICRISRSIAIPSLRPRSARRCITIRQSAWRLPKTVPSDRAIGPADDRSPDRLPRQLKLRIVRTVEEPLAWRIAMFRSDRRMRLRLAVGVEGQLDLHPARIVDEELPERRLGNDELAPRQAVFLEAAAKGLRADGGQRHVIGRHGAIGWKDLRPPA